jgi:hypothetical protein
MTGILYAGRSHLMRYGRIRHRRLFVQGGCKTRVFVSVFVRLTMVYGFAILLTQSAVGTGERNNPLP